MAYTFQTGRVERHLDVFRWDDRLVAYEQAREFWWCTLDVRGRRDVREFWQECVENERVGRLYLVERAFHRTSPSGAKMVLGPYCLYVVVAQDNSGMARINDGTTWHSFPATQVWGIRKKLAARPTIWSRRFLAKFALRGLDAIGAALEEEVLKGAPESIQAIWQQGASALPIRLIAAAFFLGWVGFLWREHEPLQFWREMLKKRSWEGSLLPKALITSPEAALPGKIALSGRPSTSQAINSAIFSWHEPHVSLWLEFSGRSESAHEMMEYRLELRDWLSQFFSPDEVESFFAPQTRR